MSEQPNAPNTGGDEPADYINLNEVDQEIVLNQDLPAPEDNEFEEEEEEEGEEGEEDDDESNKGGETSQPLEMAPENEQADIEIEMSNNSIGYFDKHTDSIFSISHHPRVPLVVTGGGDNKAHLWTSHSVPPKFATTIDHTESVIAAEFSKPLGKYLVTSDMNGLVKVSKSSKDGSKWKFLEEIQQVEEVVWLKTHPTVESMFAFGANDGSVWCYNIEDNNELTVLFSGFIHQQDCSGGDFLNVQEDGSAYLVTAAMDGTVVVWNCYTGDVVNKWASSDFKGLETPWVSLKTYSNNMCCLGANNGCLAVVNCTSGHVLHLTPCVIELKPEEDELGASIESIAWSPESHSIPLLCIGLVRGDVIVYDTASMRIRTEFQLPDSVTKILFRGTDIYISSIDGKVYKYDSRRFQEPSFTCVGHNMGVLDFCFAGEDKIITAGDEGVSLIYKC
ncbi:Ribosome assembly protein SQT1 [Hanseniaspora osmophila]|uniref:Ribosome assembly protein SQT1 n=1 Tax=Hanseniaspora osmophila TaxID=56408 RepID=A0A1E5R1D0_9ASCO|nr:Ribosome assembly protein SQT1 [Hanseniaspora osmophila]